AGFFTAGFFAAGFAAAFFAAGFAADFFAAGFAADFFAAGFAAGFAAAFRGADLVGAALEAGVSAMRCLSPKDERFSEPPNRKTVPAAQPSLRTHHRINPLVALAY